MIELKVQEFLRKGHSLEELKSQLGIKFVENEDGRVILNYDQIDTPKTHPIAMECRGLTLDRKQNWAIVGRAFDRFFNLGEYTELTGTFDWSEFECYTKEDGSLTTLYYHDGWKVNTRGSFAQDECNFSGKTWAELFFELLCVDVDSLSEEATYIFEFWTPFNKVVRVYNESQIILIGMRHNITGHDFNGKALDIVAEAFGFRRPARYVFNSLNEIERFLEAQESADPTFEGVVLRDKNGLRIKVKSKTYVALHRMCDNGNMYNPKNLVPFILAGESDELLTYFPEAESAYRECEAKVNTAFDSAFQIFYEAREIVEQKKFALYITKEKQTPFAGLMFTLKKKYGQDVTDGQFIQAWRESADTIIKVLYK